MNVCYWFSFLPQEIQWCPLFQTHITIPPHFDGPYDHSKNVLFHGTAGLSRTFITDHRVKLQSFPVDFEWSIESVAKRFGKPLYLLILPEQCEGSKTALSHAKREHISHQQVTKFVTLSVFMLQTDLTLFHFYNFLFDQVCTWFYVLCCRWIIMPLI